MEIEEVSFATNAIALVAHGAFVNTKTGQTYGQTTCRHWSKETMSRLKALREAMEIDMAALVFEGASSAPSDSRGIAMPDPGGIGEHAGHTTDVEPL